MSNMPTPFEADSITLTEARKNNRDNFEKGTECWCCGQFVKLYGHTINSQMAKCLVQMFALEQQEEHDEWIHVLQELRPSNRMYSLARHWGLIEARGDEGEQKSSGYWRLTQKGRNFVEGKIKVAKHAYIFNDKVFALDPETEDIWEALDNKFDYKELMTYIA